MTASISTRIRPSTRVHFTDLAPHAHWLLRIGFASVFLFHGIGKLIAPAQFADMMGLPFRVAIAVAVAEVAGGLGLLAGAALRRDWMTRLAALATVPMLVGAIVMVHWGQWSFVATETHPLGGMEFQVVLLLTALYFAIRGNEVCLGRARRFPQARRPRAQPGEVRGDQGLPHRHHELA
jgi:putative oxidoreductase